jgi:hypothetical protein
MRCRCVVNRSVIAVRHLKVVSEVHIWFSSLCVMGSFEERIVRGFSRKYSVTGIMDKYSNIATAVAITLKRGRLRICESKFRHWMNGRLHVDNETSISDGVLAM